MRDRRFVRDHIKHKKTSFFDYFPAGCCYVYSFTASLNIFVEKIMLFTLLITDKLNDTGFCCIGLSNL